MENLYVSHFSKSTWPSKAVSLRTKRECSNDSRKLKFFVDFAPISETSAYSHLYGLTISIVSEQLYSIQGPKHVFFLPAPQYFLDSWIECC